LRAGDRSATAVVKESGKIVQDVWQVKDTERKSLSAQKRGRRA